jgi:endonuclease YncB( thermonuclease family)
MDGLCNYVPETNVKGRLHEFMEQAKHYAKSNGIGIWSEGENPETTSRVNQAIANGVVFEIFPMID